MNKTNRKYKKGVAIFDDGLQDRFLEYNINRVL